MLPEHSTASFLLMLAAVMFFLFGVATIVLLPVTLVNAVMTVVYLVVGYLLDRWARGMVR